MASIAPGMERLDLAPQRATFAVEFVDPIGGGLVTRGLRVTADGLAPPTVTPSNRFVWVDRDPPVDRRIRLEAVSVDQMFAPFAEVIDVPAHIPGRPIRSLIFRRRLRPTGLYEPPQGMTGVAGMLFEGDGSNEPVADVRVRIHFRHAEGLETATGRYTGFTDSKGRFTAVVRRLGDVRPDPDPDVPGTFNAWLTLRRGEEVRVFETLSLRLGRLTRIMAPLKWARLARPDIDEDE
jgi:hypothetical protein